MGHYAIFGTAQERGADHRTVVKFPIRVVLSTGADRHTRADFVAGANRTAGVSNRRSNPWNTIARTCGTCRDRRAAGQRVRDHSAGDHIVHIVRRSSRIAGRSSWVEQVRAKAV